MFCDAALHQLAKLAGDRALGGRGHLLELADEIYGGVEVDAALAFNCHATFIPRLCNVCATSTNVYQPVYAFAVFSGALAAADPERGKRIKAAMDRLGYGPVALGSEVGARRETIYRWTKGGPIDPALLGRLAEVLGMSRTEIMGPGPEALEEASEDLREETRRREEKDPSNGTDPAGA